MDVRLPVLRIFFIGVLCVPLDGVSRIAITYREQHKTQSKNTRENPSFLKQVSNWQSPAIQLYKILQELDRPSIVIGVLK
jgi:hypothetical protein